jgi:hypothetical protein
MNRLIFLFFAKASVLCFHLSMFIRTTEFSLSASLIVILYGMNVIFEISDFRRGVAEIFVLRFAAQRRLVVTGRSQR